MHCELCGKEILGKPKRVVVEGAELETCAACGSLVRKFVDLKRSSGPLVKSPRTPALGTETYIDRWRANSIPTLVRS
jgi:ribosome-binding protein aMBF1 (putative translation factor)